MLVNRNYPLAGMLHESYCRLFKYAVTTARKKNLTSRQFSLSSMVTDGDNYLTFQKSTKFKFIKNIINVSEYFFFPDIGQNIVLYDQRAIYLAIPKVANSSLKTFFADVIQLDGESNRRGGKAYLFNHPKDREKLIADRVLITKSQIKDLKNYWKFAFVRNPWDRLVSFYTSALASEHIMNTLAKAYGSLFWSEMSFESFVNSVTQIPDLVANRHFVSQHKYLIDKTDKLIPDYVGRFENLNNDLEFIRRQLEIQAVDFRNVNKTTNKFSYQEFYTRDLQAMIAQRYKVDIAMFNYTF